MSNVAETPAPYIVCSEYCGKAIANPETDHDPECAAPLTERARIGRELRVLRIRSSAAAIAEAEEIVWRCSCGEERSSQDDLAGHHTETGHSGMWMVDAAAGTEDVIDVEVDGKRAKVKRGPAREETREVPPWQDPQTHEAWVTAAQTAIDNGEVVLGGLPAGKKCPGRRVIDGIEVACPHLIAMRTVEKTTCDHERKHTKTVSEACLIHGILLFGVGLAPAGNGPLFETTP